MSDWRPISTAPKDETWILGYDPDGPRESNVWLLHWITPNPPPAAGFWACDEWLEWHPTHWMPLPTPPGSEVKP